MIFNDFNDSKETYWFIIKIKGTLIQKQARTKKKKKKLRLRSRCRSSNYNFCEAGQLEIVSEMEQEAAVIAVE